MSRTEHLIVYRPTEEIINRILNRATLVEEWTGDGDKREILFEMDDSISREKDLRDFLYEQINKENPETVIGTSYPSESAEWIDSETSLRDRLTIHDLLPNEPEVADVIYQESRGGDIRKYVNTLYGQKFSIDFKLARSQKINITGMEPMTPESMRTLLDIGVVEKGLYRYENPQYPPAERILLWDELVNKEWGLETGGMGSIHIPYRDHRDISAGFDGFVIYDADQQVKNWCDQRWNAVDSWSNRDELDFPFMYPDEYDLRLDSEKWVTRSAIRMWWD